MRLAEAAHLLHIEQSVCNMLNQPSPHISCMVTRSPMYLIVRYRCLQPHNEPVFQHHCSASLSGGAQLKLPRWSVAALLQTRMHLDTFHSGKAGMSACALLYVYVLGDLKLISSVRVCVCVYAFVSVHVPVLRLNGFLSSNLS